MPNRLLAHLLAAALCCCAIVPAAGQQTAAADPSASSEAGTDATQAFFEAWRKAEFMDAYRALGGLDPAAMDERSRQSYAQFRPSLDGFVVDRGNERPVDPEQVARFGEAERRDAIDAIVERARQTRIVIVNETHDNPRDRAFVLELAEALRPHGFTHYAAETFNNWGDEQALRSWADRLVERGHADLETGFYTTEPTFGFLVRRVLALGYRPVPYEHQFGGPPPADMEESVALREAGQAANLARAIAAAGPEAKFLIHVGYSHAAEEPVANGQLWMAGQLKALTGIDPLTVDQAGLSQYAHPALHRTIAPLIGDQPAVFFSEGEPLRVSPNAALMDMEVVHPPIAVVGGRPDWLARTGRRAVTVPAELMPDSGVRLVQAFLVADGDTRLPVDQVLVETGDAPPLVYVPEGEIRWGFQD